ncbi:energy transducer TonB [Bacteroidales bacterium OttesenSCG-928-C19]|nr:energy transducer TonB [Bacteroidales bacterium OttesenSCG-928-C19]
MEAKKSPKADLEGKKGIFVEIGLAVVLLIVLVAFNWKSYDKDDFKEVKREAEEVLEETVIQTSEMNEPPPPPPEPEIELSSDVMEVVEDDAELKNEVVIKNEDDIAKTMQDFKPVVNQQVDEEEEEEEIFLAVEDEPSFQGGEAGLRRYLAENIKYPQLAKETNVQGRVFVTFVVERDGSVSNVRILRDIGAGCGAEAVRVVKAMPKWTPGKQRGKAVRVQYNLPVMFTLQ